MTALSTNLPASSSNLRAGSRLATNLPAEQFGVPPAIASALWLHGNSWNSWGDDELRALSRAKHEGILDLIPQLAEKALQALAPVDGAALVRRLTLLGMTMPNAKSDDEKRAWLHEMARLLGDYPQSVLFQAIDECVKEPGRVWCPAVGEIIAKAEPLRRQKEREAARLQAIANRLATGVEIPVYQPPEPSSWQSTAKPKEEERCTPEEARRILVVADG